MNDKGQKTASESQCEQLLMLLGALFDCLQESFQPIEQVVATLLEREYTKLEGKAAGYF